ncbi:MAG: 1-acyl-sn-glycerol-3-phosphate acyltransferase [Bacteroidales bacterium]
MMTAREGIAPAAENHMLGITERTIDIREVVRSKSERLARMLPGFAYRYLRKILHEEEINKFLWENRHRQDFDFVDAVLRFFNVRVTVHGIENIPAEGKVILASNHPLGGLDGVALMHTIGRVRRDAVIMVNDLLMFLPNVRNLFVPVNKHGRNTENINAVNRVFAGENIIPMFPAGLCSRKQSGVICDLEWKSTFVSQARRNQRIVVPVYFSGRNSNFFYNLARLRKFFRIKANIEMFFLVNEMFKQYDKEFVITIGEPIPHTRFDKSRKPREWADWVKDIVYRLGEGK